MSPLSSLSLLRLSVRLTAFLPLSPLWALGLVMLVGLPGCAGWVNRPLADVLAQQGKGLESDPGLAREAGAFYLVLSESVLRQTPDHAALGEAVAAGLTRYAFAFVSQEADFVEATDPRRASALRQRAARLYHRARLRAVQGLASRIPHFSSAFLTPAQNPLSPETVGLAYWAAAAWGGQIVLSTDDPDVVADFPQAVQLARWAWAIDPTYGRGDLAALMGSFEAARPGGSLKKAGDYFDQAIALAGQQSAGAYVSKAERWAVPAGDREAFEQLLKQARSVRVGDDHPLALTNQIFQDRAQWLLNRADELF